MCKYRSFLAHDNHRPGNRLGPSRPKQRVVEKTHFFVVMTSLLYSFVKSDQEKRDMRKIL